MSSRAEALDLAVQITTPENIRFEYRLAGPFRRMPAAFLDFLFRAAFIVGILMLGICSGILARLPFAGVFLTVAIAITYFLLTWFYGLFFETFWNGQTPGKRVLGLRVISIDGRPINAVQATIRNFLRVADTAPLLSLEYFSSELPPAYILPTFMVAIVCMIATKRMQRIGDLAAGTMVVVDEKGWYPRHAKLDDPRIISLAEYIPAGFRMSRTLAQTVALFMERREKLSPRHRAELASAVAVPLLKRFGFQEDTSADLLLCALYYRDFIAKSADAWSLEDKATPPASRFGSPLKTEGQDRPSLPDVPHSVEPPNSQITEVITHKENSI